MTASTPCRWTVVVAHQCPHDCAPLPSRGAAKGFRGYADSANILCMSNAHRISSGRHAGPSRLAAGDQAALRRDLERAWEAMVGRPPGDLAPDLRLLEPWFGPPSRAAGIARRLDALPAVGIAEEWFGAFEPPLLLGGPNAAVVTPEGRVALDRLHDGSYRANEPRSAPDPLADLYRTWASSTVLDVLNSREGRGEKLRPPALAVATLVAVLGAVGEEGALVLRRDMAPESEAIVRETLGEFANSLSPRAAKVLKDPPWGWPITKARQRFPALWRETIDGVERWWIEPTELDAMLRSLAHELRRREPAAPTDTLRTARGFAERWDERTAKLPPGDATQRKPFDRAEIARRLQALLPARGA